MLQADKSAFKAKKIGGNKGVNKPVAKGGKGAAGKSVDVESIDFNKKILHGKSLPTPSLATDTLSYSLMASAGKHRASLPPRGRDELTRTVDRDRRDE